MGLESYTSGKRYPSHHHPYSSQAIPMLTLSQSCPPRVLRASNARLLLPIRRPAPPPPLAQPQNRRFKALCLSRVRLRCRRRHRCEDNGQVSPLQPHPAGARHTDGASPLELVQRRWEEVQSGPTQQDGRSVAEEGRR